MPSYHIFKSRKASYFLQLHKQICIKWAQIKLGCDNSNWKQVIFTDEKNFILDVSDGLECYQQDAPEYAEIFSTKQQNEATLLVYGVDCQKGTLNLAVIHENLDLPYYFDLLEQVLVAKANAKLVDAWTLIQDNISMYTSNHTLSSIKSNKINTLDWLAESLNLNIIENL